MRALWFVLALTLVACTPPSTKFRVATDPHHAPLSFLDPQGRPTGFEIDLMTALAQNQNWDLEVVTTTTDGLIRGAEGTGILGGLNKDEYDAVISSVEGSNRLLDRWSLSRPYLNAGPVVMVPANAPTPVLDSGWTGLVGVIEGSPGASEVRKSPVPTWRVRNYFDPASALEDLALGNLTGAVVGNVEVAEALFDNEGLQVAVRFTGPPLTQDRTLVVVTRQDDPRLAALDRGLDALDKSGVTAALMKKWFLAP